MATRKKNTEEVLDANGKSLFPGGLWRHKSKDNGFRVYEDDHGKKYWLNDGERDYDLPYIIVGRLPASTIPISSPSTVQCRSSLSKATLRDGAVACGRRCIIFSGSNATSFWRIMMTETGMDERVSVLISRGIPRASAELFISLIGDTPETDLGGKIIVRDESGAEIARIDPI
jgi:hypothetical protein